MIKVDCYVVGEIATNCYLIEDEASGALAVIDPGDRCEELYEEIDRRGGKLEYVLLTHGHFDHILGVSALCERYSPTVCACEQERVVLQRGLYNLTSVHNIRLNSFVVDRFLNDSDIIKLGESEIRFISTPGHTVGSGCYIVGDCVFSGDTIFCESVGRTDFPTSSFSDMRRSVARVRDLDGDYRIYPGHEMFTTLSHEREYNPFMNGTY